MGEAAAIWPLRSEHSGAFLRLQRLLEGRQSFTLCFLIYSDSFYRDQAASFLEERMGARVRVSIDPDTSIGTEDLFERLNAAPRSGPAQLVGLDQWPEGIDNLLTRLNYRREALAERCKRPLLFWVLSRDLNEVTTKAADLWAWRSGVFDFTLPASTSLEPLHRSRLDQSVADLPRRRARMEELQQYLEDRPSLRPIDVDLLLELGDLRRGLGDLAQAEEAYSGAEQALSDMDDRRRWAITRGRIADILEVRGQLDEALRIRTEEALPVFKELDDVRALAITRGRIADILEVRGQLDEALRIRTEEEIPVYEKLGDVRAIAVTQSKIADVFQIRGQLDEALRIRKEEQLPVFEELGDVRSIAITQGRIADIYQARGQLDEALRIRTEEELPVFKTLDDVRSLAIVQGRIADILQIRGQFGEALRVRTEEELPVFEEIGDVRAIAVTQARIADILEARGSVEEALRVYERDVLRNIEALEDPAQIELVRNRIASLRASSAEPPGD